MFGRKTKGDAKTPTTGPTTGTGSAAPDDSSEAQRGRAVARLDADRANLVALNETGLTGVSTVLSVETGPINDRLAEERIRLSVKPDAGETFEATIVQARIGGLAAKGPTTSVGKQRRVVFDANDHTRVGWRLDDVVRRIRWHVPSTCPGCGAAVDQSTAALAEHPTCDHCHQPLPCEPFH